MDWARAIDLNRTALTRIVAAFVSLLAAQGGRVLPVPVYQLIARVLHPAESAVRRLIVIAARGLAVSEPVVRPMPKGLVIVRKGTRMVFPLFDTRKTFRDVDDETQPIAGPRIRSIDDPNPRSVFLAQFAKPHTDTGTASEAETLRVSQRLLMIKQALDTLPRQAKRMARWLKRRAAMTQPTFKTPLRPGPPPGLRKRSKDEIDEVLRECHALAWDALRPNTS
jgi:hypothetical protein